MKKAISLLIVLILTAKMLLFSQEQELNCINLRQLETTDAAKGGQVYIDYNKPDSSNKIFVYLINKTPSSVDLQCLNQRIEFNIEAQMPDGDWGKLDMREGYCGTGYGNFILPAQAYTWQSFYSTVLADGNYKTQVRFTYVLGDTLLKSEPLSASIDINRFLPPQLRIIQQIDTYLSGHPSTTEQEKKLLLVRAQLLIQFNQYDEVLDFSKKLIYLYPDFHEMEYIMGIALVGNISRTNNLSDAEKYGILSKAIAEWRKVPFDNVKYKDARKFISIYNNYLPTKEEWNKVNSVDCKMIEGRCYYFITQYVNEWVEILFK